MLKKLALFGILVCAQANASITLTTPYSVPAAGTNSMTTLSVPNVACLPPQEGGNRTTGSASVPCYFGTIVESGGTDQSLTKLQGEPPIIVSLNWATGLNTVTFKGTVLYSTTLTGTALTNATSTFQAGFLAVQNATETYLITAADTGGTAILQGTISDTW